MGQGDGGRGWERRQQEQAQWLAANPAPTFYDKGIARFDKAGMLGGELFNGLTFEKSALESYRNTQVKRAQDAFKMSDAGRLFGRQAPQIPMPFESGGNIQGFKFDASGKLYGVVGQKTVQESDADGNVTSRSMPEMIEMTGVQWDTSTVPKGTPGKFYDAAIQQDNDGNILEIKDPDAGNVVGYARAMIQRQVDADSRLGGGSSRTATPGADTRVASTLLGGPSGDARKVTTKE